MDHIKHEPCSTNEKHVCMSRPMKEMQWYATAPKKFRNSSFSLVTMMSITGATRRFCAQAVTNATPEGFQFTGRVGTASNPRTLAPVITSNVINSGKDISFTCISRLAAAKAMHAAAIANVKNMEKGRQAFVRVALISDLLPKEGMVAKGLSSFRVSMLSEERPCVFEKSFESRRTKIAATTDYMELAKNLHISYLRKTSVILECMGDKSLGVIAHSLACFNEKVTSHELLAYPTLVTGQSADGSVIAKLEIQVIEKSKQ